MLLADLQHLGENLRPVASGVGVDDGAGIAIGRDQMVVVVEQATRDREELCGLGNRGLNFLPIRVRPEHRRADSHLLHGGAEIGRLAADRRTAENAAIGVIAILLPIVVAIAVAMRLVTKIGNLHRLAALQRAAECLDAGNGQVTSAIDIKRPLFAGQNFAREIVKRPEIAAPVARPLSQFAKPFPAGIDLHHRRLSGRSKPQPHAVVADLKRAQSAPNPLLVTVVGGRPHEVADDAAIAHLDERRRHGSVVCSLRSKVTGEARAAAERLDRHRPGAGDRHHRAQRMRAVIMEIEPASPAMDRVSRPDGNAVDIGVCERAALVNIFVFGVHQVTEEALFPAVGKPHVGGSEGVILREVVNELALLNLFDQLHALCHGEEAGNLGKNMLAGLKTLDRVRPVSGTEGRKKNRIEILLEELVLIVGDERARIGLEEVGPHVLVEVATRHDIDIEELAGVEKAHAPAKPPNTQAQSLFRVKNSGGKLSLCHSHLEGISEGIERSVPGGNRTTIKLPLKMKNFNRKR